MADKIEFIEKKLIGTIESDKNWKIRLALMQSKSSKGTNDYFDLRKVKTTNSETIFGKGLTLQEEELKELAKMILDHFEGEGKVNQ